MSAPLWSPGMVEAKRSRYDGWIELARKYRLQRVITRLLDGLGLGDNYVFVLEKP